MIAAQHTGSTPLLDQQGVDVSVANESVSVVPQRRCGRCRQDFPLAAGDDARTAAQWWLCGPCRARLLPDMKP